jgi:hypothetical protein
VNHLPRGDALEISAPRQACNCSSPRSTGARTPSHGPKVIWTLDPRPDVTQTPAGNLYLHLQGSAYLQ